jgi:hypothetical protein
MPMWVIIGALLLSLGQTGAGSQSDQGLPGAAPTESGGTDDLLVHFVRTHCFAEVDRLQAAREFVGSSWRLVRSEEELDVTFSVDAAVPKNDRLTELWEREIGGGTVRLNVARTDYEDPAQRDYSSATLWISPDHLIDIAAVSSALGLELTPSGPLAHRPGAMVIHHRDGSMTSTPPSAGQLQHYSGRIRLGNAAVEISAMRAWGAGYRNQYWRFSCSSGQGSG